MFWKLEEARLVQSRLVQSAANADSLTFSAYPVPEGKVWVVLGFGYYPSVAETQEVGFHKIDKATYQYAVLNPASRALSASIPATMIEQGMEYLLLPGEYLAVSRGNHTAGSVMTAVLQFVEIDLPLYTYDEPQVVKRQVRAVSSIRARLGNFGGGGSVTRPPSDLGGKGGGRTGPLEK